MKWTLTRSGAGRLAAAALLAANVVVPLLWGDVYPFTSAPMFCDSPRQFCNYRVYGADGKELSAADWLVQRVYDGNPVGYGVGVRPPAVIEQQFGVIHDEATVRQHFQRQFAEPPHQQHEFIDVVQEVVGPVDAQHVGVVRTQGWRISRSAN
jgi:hypothetical protein